MKPPIELAVRYDKVHSLSKLPPWNTVHQIKSKAPQPFGVNTWYIRCNCWIWDIHHYLTSSVLAYWLFTALILILMNTLHASFRIFYLSTCALYKSLLLLQGHELRKCPSSSMPSIPIYSYHPRIPCKIKCFLFLPLTHCFLLRKSVFSSAQFVSRTLSNLFHTKQFWSRSLKNLHLLNPLSLVSQPTVQCLEPW